MGKRRTKALIVVVAVVLVASGAWLAHDLLERRKAAEREAYYQTVLTRFTRELKPGMTRAQVEQYFQRNGKQFKQMCCVANFKSEHVTLLDAGWDDLIKIGQESTPWFCNENNVYVAFEFNPKSQGELSKTNGSDILKRVSIFHQLERCL